MSFKFRGPTATLLMAVGVMPAYAQSTDSGRQELEEVVVTGIRSSLDSAQEFKRESSQIVDSIVAEDIGKLPDINVSDALQRITGVQIGRDVGEGGTVAIRGLPQVATTLNGRVAFTAGGGRAYNFSDIPAELLKSVNVYKSPTSNLVEGGLGGTIDLRTRKPFDFEGLQLNGSLLGRYADLADETKPQASLLASDRFDTGIGEIGVLVAVAYQDRAYRQDLNSTGAPAPRTDLIPGRTVFSPNGSYEPLINGERKRTGVDTVVQWQATDRMVVAAEFNYQNFETVQDQYGVNMPTNGQAPIAGSFETFPGTDDFMRGSFSNLPFSTFGVARDVEDTNKMYALNAEWTGERLTLRGDVSYTESTNDLYYTELDLRGVAPTFTQDLSTSVPSAQLIGVDTTSIGAFSFGPLTRSENHFEGDEVATQFDAEFKMDQGFLTSVMAGVRYGDRAAEFTPIRFFVNPPATAASSLSGLVARTPFNDFFSETDSGVPLPRDYLIVPANLLRGNGFDSVRQQLGIAAVPTVSPLSVFDIEEKTLAAYARANFEFDTAIPIDGNLGVRFVQTDNTLTGNKANFVNGVQQGFVPVNQDSDYNNVLPSLNVRARFTDELQLRFAASKVITRPDFSQLSPSLTLVPANGQATSGNPDLEPLEADQFDLSLEYYFARGASAYIATFYKEVKGFIQTSVTPNVLIDGVLYNLAQPTNGDDGKIKGAEVGYQQFFDFLPGWLDGLGMQANYTYVDSSAPSSVAGLKTTLPQLSKNSYNLIAIYEKGPISTRIAYNWRDDFYESIFVGTGSLGVNPVYRKAYGWLDASFVWDVHENISLALEGANLLRTKRKGFYSVETRPNDRTIDDRQILFGVRVRL